ncbi:unnamed protein product, partial [Closterium sp. Naga37s-1]
HGGVEAADHWGEIPPGRSYHTMAVDPHRAQIYIFGGCGTSIHSFTPILTSTTPHSLPPHSPRSYHTMAADPHRTQILHLRRPRHHSLLHNIPPPTPPLSPPLSSQELSYHGSRSPSQANLHLRGDPLLHPHSQLHSLTPTPSTPHSFPPRSYHTMAADTHRTNIYIFGGCGTTHTLVSYHTMAADPHRTQIYISGGCMLTFTLSLIPSHPLCPPRSYHTMAADPHRSQIYIFGGCGTTGRFNDLWAYPAGTSVAPTTTPTHNVSLFPTPPLTAWKQLPSPPPSSSCVPRGGPGLAVAGDAVWVLFGFSGEHELGDVHRFDLGKEIWEEVQFPPAAAAGADAAGSVDANKGDEEARESVVKPIPRSVFGAVTVSLPAADESACKEYIVVYGGEVDPSDLGHLGAGKFSKDLFLLDVEERKWLQAASLVSSGGDPGARGWFPVAPLAAGMVVCGIPCAAAGSGAVAAAAAGSAAAGAAKRSAGMVVHGGNSESNDRLEDVFVLRLAVA